MAIELTDELVTLQRHAFEEQAKAAAGVYSAEAWAPWLEAATALDAAVTVYAKESGQNRLEVAMAVRRNALESAVGPGVV